VVIYTGAYRAETWMRCPRSDDRRLCAASFVTITTAAGAGLGGVISRRMRRQHCGDVAASASVDETDAVHTSRIDVSIYQQRACERFFARESVVRLCRSYMTARLI
jgi:hypothetical protein